MTVDLDGDGVADIIAVDNDGDGIADATYTVDAKGGPALGTQARVKAQARRGVGWISSGLGLRLRPGLGGGWFPRQIQSGLRLIFRPGLRLIFRPGLRVKPGLRLRLD